MTTSGFKSIRASDSHEEAANFSFTDVVEDARATFKTGKTKNIAWRKQQLGQLKKLIQENHEDITAAILADHGGPKLRGTVYFIFVMIV